MIELTAADLGMEELEEEQGQRSIYTINVREIAGQFVLYNGDVVCGDRMWRPKVKKGPVFPLEPTGPGRYCDWNTYPTRKAADKAAKKLQAYLDKCEALRPKKGGQES